MVFPCDTAALETGSRLAEENIADVSLFGPRDRLLELGAREGIDLQRFELIDTGAGAASAAQKACKLAAAGSLDMLMKGSLHTDELMRAVVARNDGLRTQRRISLSTLKSHAAVVLAGVESLLHIPTNTSRRPAPRGDDRPLEEGLVAS